MNAEEFLKNKGIGRLTIKAVRLPHKYKNIELELIPLMEEYAELKLLGIANLVGRSEQLVCDCGKPYHERDLEHGICHQCWEPTKEAN